MSYEIINFSFTLATYFHSVLILKIIIMIHNVSRHYEPSKIPRVKSDLVPTVAH